MSERSDLHLLKAILASIQYIKDFVAGLSFEQYDADLKVKHAVERNFTIIGEAASKLSSEFRSTYSYIELRKIIGFRNILVHDYMGIDSSVVWEIIQY